MVIPLLVAFGTEPDFSAGHARDRVREQVARDPFQVSRIEIAARHFAIVNGERQSFVDGLRRAVGSRIGDDPIRIDARWRGRDAATGNLVEVQHVADRQIHEPGGGADARQDGLAVLLLKIFVIEEIDKAGDRGDRAANVVRHGGDLRFPKGGGLLELVDLRVQSLAVDADKKRNALRQRDRGEQPEPSMRRVAGQRDQEHRESIEGEARGAHQRLPSRFPVYERGGRDLERAGSRCSANRLRASPR